MLILLTTPSSAIGQVQTDWVDEDAATQPIVGAMPQQPSPTLLNQKSFEQSARLLSVFEKIGLLELDLYGKTNPKTPILDRLDNLEKTVFAPGLQALPKLPDRVDRLILALKPSNELVSLVVLKATSSPTWSSKFFTCPWANTCLQEIQALEYELNNKISTDDSLADRVAALEKIVNPSQSLAPQSNLQDRIDQLAAQVPVSDKTVEKVKRLTNDRASSFLNPPQIHWLNSLGRTAKRFGKGAADTTKSVVSSPVFWELLVLGGAVTALYFIERGSHYSGPVYVSNENGCIGALSCNRCKNCRYCEYCNDGYGHYCGVRLQWMRLGY